MTVTQGCSSDTSGKKVMAPSGDAGAAGTTTGDASGVAGVAGRASTGGATGVAGSAVAGDAGSVNAGAGGDSDNGGAGADAGNVSTGGTAAAAGSGEGGAGNAGSGGTAGNGGGGGSAGTAGNSGSGGNAGAPTGWVYVRIGDCPGTDSAIGYSTGTDIPVAGDCTPAQNGLAAVCWDQTTYTNTLIPGSQPGCTYKTISEATCTGGIRPGYLYVCNQP
ncbi:MAG TPA: hypothetical protein VIK01_09895 [Polyangiaceae bacterium]